MKNTKTMGVGRIIRDSSRVLSGAGVGQARLEAAWLAGHVLGLTPAQLLGSPELILSEEDRETFDGLISRRCRREPFQYLVGTQEFWGLEFHVNPNVLIPRPETEHMIEAVRDLFPDPRARISAADIGTGSGCLAVTLATLFPGGKFMGIDRSPEALEMARENARRHGVEDRIEFLEGDLFAPLLDKRTPDTGLDVILSNPPYVPSDQLESLQPEVGLYEPSIALDGGKGGLDLYPRIISGAPGFLRPGGYLCLEIGMGQDGAVVEMAEAAGLKKTRIIHDLQGIPRTLIFQKRDAQE